MVDLCNNIAIHATNIVISNALQNTLISPHLAVHLIPFQVQSDQ